MQRWEYRTLVVDAASDSWWDGERQIKSPSQSATLDQLGADGWELVGSVSAGSYGRLYFKRPRS